MIRADFADVSQSMGPQFANPRPDFFLTFQGKMKLEMAYRV